jgi:hypothetical protein
VPLRHFNLASRQAKRRCGFSSFSFNVVIDFLIATKRFSFSAIALPSTVVTILRFVFRYFKGFVRAVQHIESMEEEMRADRLAHQHSDQVCCANVLGLFLVA